MTDSMLYAPIATGAAAGFPWLLLAAAALAVAAACYTAGYVAHHAHRRWPPPTVYEQEGQE